MKIRILACTEATYLNTGYAVYFRELLKVLHKDPRFEVAELAAYASSDEPKIHSVPWKMYCNQPDSHATQELKEYNENSTNQFGAWKFEAACLDFKPNFVLSIRDFWMDSFIDISPFRKYFKWIWMPTVDAAPQNDQWIEMYNKCDAVLTYNDWSGLILQHQSNNRIKWFGSAPPIADPIYKPYNKEEIKTRLGFDSNVQIIGTVMRNQRRKLFPDLFQSFRKYLDLSKSNNTYLYCHTSYPDNGWDIPYYLKEYNICSKTLFTYVCEKCQQVFPSFFQDAVTFCVKCGQPAATLTNVHNGAGPEIMSYIYNMFDLYIQYANSEGFGIPLVEAAACGIPIMAIDYSAMTDILKKLQGISIKCSSFVPEIETGCLRAVPDNDDCAEKILSFFNMPKEDRIKLGRKTQILSQNIYSLNKTVNQWIACIEKLGVLDDKLTWNSPPKIHQPENKPQDGLSNKEFVKWLIACVLGEPERLNSHMELRMVKDLNFRVTTGGLSGMYYNESSRLFGKPQYNTFGPEEAFNFMVNLCNRRNFWERQRCGIN